MEVLYTVLITLLIIWTGLSIFFIRNLMKKNDTMEEYIAELDSELRKTEKALDVIDNRGHFRADDEIGFYFQQIKQLQENISNFKLK